MDPTATTWLAGHIGYLLCMYVGASLSRGHGVTQECFFGLHIRSVATYLHFSRRSSAVHFLHRLSSRILISNMKQTNTHTRDTAAVDESTTILASFFETGVIISGRKKTFNPKRDRTHDPGARRLRVLTNSITGVTRDVYRQTTVHTIQQ